MLAALSEVIRDTMPNAKIVLDPTSADYVHRAKYGVFQLAQFKKFGINLAQIFALLPQRVRQRFGIVLPKEIDVILDASGFAYGDQWGAAKLKSRLADNLKNFKSAKLTRKVILLPQAFGPFEGPGMRAAMQEVIEQADLVFARDPDSFTYLNQVKSSETVRLAPDFTNLFRAAYAGEFDRQANKICFIPNAKMLEMKHSGEGNEYAKFMAGLLKQACDANLNPFLLIHEGQKDRKLGEEIMRLANCDVPLFHPDNAADVKAIIGLSKLVISSRFHGLVSALSQGVPVLATGWSHKYQRLLADYGVADCLFDERVDAARASEMMLKLGQDEVAYQQMVENIASKSIEEKAKTKDMWQQVFKVLRG